MIQNLFLMEKLNFLCSQVHSSFDMYLSQLAGCADISNLVVNFHGKSLNKDDSLYDIFYLLIAPTFEFLFSDFLTASVTFV